MFINGIFVFLIILLEELMIFCQGHIIANSSINNGKRSTQFQKNAQRPFCLHDFPGCFF